MTSPSEAPPAVVRVVYAEKTFGPYDPFHGTNAPMLWRRVTIETARGKASFEQTDYGHPGRLNPWEPRGVDSTLTPKLGALAAVAEAVAALQS